MRREAEEFWTKKSATAREAAKEEATLPPSKADANFLKVPSYSVHVPTANPIYIPTGLSKK